MGKIKLIAIIATVLVLSTVTSFFVAIAVSAQKDQIYHGVQVGNIDLGGLSKEEAREELTALNKQEEDRVIQVIHPAGEVQVKLSQIDARVDVENILTKAWGYGRTGSLIEQWQERKRIAKQGVQIPYTIKYSDAKFVTLANQIGKSSSVEPVNAKLIVTPTDAVQIIPGKNGKVIDTDKALDQLKQIIDDGQEPTIRLTLKDKKPAITTEDVQNMRINGVVAHFSTFFNLAKVNRSYNIRVAAAALDGQFIKPGEVFSFNKVVGPRSEEAGYKLAPTILNNEFIDSLGGGVCQCSTTLYNCVLLTGCKIVERNSHSLVVSYVPLGQDAAVAYGGKDLKFKNTLNSWLYIKTSVAGNRITVKMLGDTSAKKDVRITNQIIKEYTFKLKNQPDATIAKGQTVVKQKGVNGYRVVSRRTVYQNGKLLWAENLPVSFYKPLDQIVLTGTKNVPVTKRNVTPTTKPKPNTDTNPGTTPPPVTPPTTTNPPAGNGDDSGGNPPTGEIPGGTMPEPIE